MEEYLTVQELSERIKFSKQSLYNLIYRKTFVLGEHYLKPTPKKILFVWSEIEGWLHQSNDESSPEAISANDEQLQEPMKKHYTTRQSDKKDPPLSAFRI